MYSAERDWFNGSSFKFDVFESNSKIHNINLKIKYVGTEDYRTGVFIAKLTDPSGGIMEREFTVYDKERSSVTYEINEHNLFTIYPIKGEYELKITPLNDNIHVKTTTIKVYER